MLFYVLALIVAYLIYHVGFKPLSYWKKQNVKQANPMPFLGDNFKILLRLESSTDLVNRLYNKYPNDRYIGTYQFNRPSLLIRDPDLIKQIGVKDFDHFTDHSPLLDPEVDPIWNKNLFALRGDSWHRMRATLSPAFTTSKMKAMFSLIDATARQFTNYFRENGDTHEIEMKDCFSRFTNDVIGTVAFGVTCDSLKEKTNEFYLMGQETTDISSHWRTLQVFMAIMLPKIAKLLGFTLFSKKILKFFSGLIDASLKFRKEQNIIRPDLIHLLMEAQRGLLKHEDNEEKDDAFSVIEESDMGKESKKKAEITDVDITAQALIFFFAGFDTVSTLMTFMSYELALHPELQTKLIAEIDETMEKCNGKLTYDYLTEMKYMDMVISESLRKWPPAIMMDRVCVKPYTIRSTKPGEPEVKLKIGDQIALPFLGLHHDENHYPDPLKFDPERFSNANKHNIKPYTYLPFGVGPRGCIGSRLALMETKTMFCHLLSKFEIAVGEKTEIPLQISKKNFNLGAANGVWLKFQKRQN